MGRGEWKHGCSRRRHQSLAISPFEIDLASPLSLGSPSFTSNSHALGGTSTAGEQLKNPCGCTHRHQKNMLKNSYEYSIGLHNLWHPIVYEFSTPHMHHVHKYVWRNRHILTTWYTAASKHRFEKLLIGWLGQTQARSFLLTHYFIINDWVKFKIKWSTQMFAESIAIGISSRTHI